MLHHRHRGSLVERRTDRRQVNDVVMAVRLSIVEATMVGALRLTVDPTIAAIARPGSLDWEGPDSWQFGMRLRDICLHPSIIDAHQQGDW